MLILCVYTLTGDTNGYLTMWDTQTGAELTVSDGENHLNNTPVEMCRWKLNDDCTNGVR